MLFNSLTYLFFLPAVYLAYIVTPKHQQNLSLLIASYFFYAWWDVRLLSLIVVSTAINYCCGMMIRESKRTVKQRRTVSLWVVSVCLFSLLINFDLINEYQKLSSFSISLPIFVKDKNTWYIFAALCLIVILCNLIYTKIQLCTQSKKRALFVIGGVTANLLILGFFKYYNFFVDNVEWIIKFWNMDPERFHLHIILPIGISFYTFKGISYIVDVYRNQVEPEQNYIKYSL